MLELEPRAIPNISLNSGAEMFHLEFWSRAALECSRAMPTRPYPPLQNNLNSRIELLHLEFWSRAALEWSSNMTNTL
jgi:hypothetical protein